MKQILLFILFMLGISSCDKAPINGKLDGRWQLMTIEYTNGKIEECNRIYYSIQLHLVESVPKVEMEALISDVSLIKEMR